MWYWKRGLNDKLKHKLYKYWIILDVTFLEKKSMVTLANEVWQMGPNIPPSSPMTTHFPKAFIFLKKDLFRVHNPSLMALFLLQLWKWSPPMLSMKTLTHAPLTHVCMVVYVCWMITWATGVCVRLGDQESSAKLVSYFVYCRLLMTMWKTALEKIVGKGEHSGNQNVLLFPKWFESFKIQRTCICHG